MPSNWHKFNNFSMGDPLAALTGGPPALTECRSAVEVAEAARNGGVVLFYATGCGPCQAFKPVFSAAAVRAPVPFFAVDAMAVPDVIQRYNLAGFPTVFKFSGGKIVGQYAGDRTEGDLLMWAADR
jgi:thiol-disulfide isomerase/thioredoxin